jgi:hypothetical protein
MAITNYIVFTMQFGGTIFWCTNLIILEYFKWFVQQVSFAGGLPQIRIFSSDKNEVNPYPLYLRLARGPKDGICGIIAIKATL